MPRNRRVRWMLLAAVTALLVVPAAGYSTYLWWRSSRLESFETRCRAALEDQRWGELQSTARRWTEWDPQNATAWMYRASAAKSRGNARQAVDLLKHVPLDDPQAVEALSHQLRLLFTELRRPLEGIEVCRQIIELQPTHQQAHRFLVHYYAMTFQRSKLIKAARRAIELYADSPDLYAYLVWLDGFWVRDGASILAEWTRSHPESRRLEVAHVIHIAQEAHRPKDYDPDDPAYQQQLKAAERQLRRMLARYPHDPILIAYLISLAVDEGDIERVGELLARAPEEAADDPVVWRYRGWYHRIRGEYEAAERAYRKVLELNPLNWRARNGLIQLYRAQQRTAKIAPLNRIVETGQELVDDIATLDQIQKIGPSLLRRIADYAMDCEDWQVARGLHRRLLPNAGPETEAQ